MTAGRRGALFGAAAVASIAATSPSAAQSGLGGEPLPEALRAAGFAAAAADVGGGRVFHVRGGPRGGSPVLLLHGFPTSWWEWHRIMPGLAAAGHDVIAIDLPGVGGSTNPGGDGSKLALAVMLRAFAEAVGVRGPMHVVGHDIGAMIAYAHAARFPDATKTLTFLDAPLPGTPTFDAISRDPRAWHFGFHAEEGLAETLVEGREEAYVRSFARKLSATPGRPDEVDVAAYARAHAGRERLRAAFGFYRAFPRDAEDNRALIARGRLTMPVLALSAGALAPTPYVLDMLRPLGDRVGGGSVAGSGHWIAEERPEELLRLLLAHLGQS